jgi:hypothetical protein
VLFRDLCPDTPFYERYRTQKKVIPQCRSYVLSRYGGPDLTTVCLTFGLSVPEDRSYMIAEIEMVG